MPNDNLTEIVMVLDRSGSMGSVKKDTEGGFDTFIEEQRKVDGDARLTLVQFDTEYEFVYDGVGLAKVKPLALVPRGATALLDAIGRTINETRERIRAVPKAERAAKVVFVILTDGYENSSKEFDREKINELIGKRRKKGWEFVFLGANQDAIAEAAKIGVPMASSMTYAHNPEGTRAAFAATSQALTSLRTGDAVAMAYSDEDREKQKKAGATS